jgi:hypothetical protein
MALFHCWCCNGLFSISQMSGRRWCDACEANPKRARNLRRGGPAASKAPGGNPPCVPGAESVPEGAVADPPPQGLLW